MYILTLGFALFAMFFGAGNLIFPPTLGRLSGDHYLFCMAGFVLTGVGLPLMGILSVAKADGGLDVIARRIDTRFAKLLSVVIMLDIGPLLAIPRTCATTFELGIAPNFPWLNSWMFSVLYFGIVIFFAVNPLSVIDRIGKYLTPALLGALAILIVKGIFWPIAKPISTGMKNPFGVAFIEGYQTMDLFAATIFGIVVLNELRSKGIFDKKKQVSAIVKAGIVSAIGLLIVYCGLLYLGATVSGKMGDISRTELLVTMSAKLLGSNGTVVLGIAVAMACLTTAIGLTVVCGQYFNKLSYGMLNYKAVCIVVALVSLFLSNAGVEKIVKIAVPPLVTLYPTVMVLVILTLFGDRIKKRNVWRGAVLGAFSVGLIEALKGCGLEWNILNQIYNAIPFTESGLGWVVPSIVLALLGAISREVKSERFRILAICPSQLHTRAMIFEDRIKVFDTMIEHKFDSIISKDDYSEHVAYITEELSKKLARELVDLSRIDAIAARGGFLKPLKSGAYKVTQAMVEDLKNNAWRNHPSNWGAAIAYAIAKANKIDSYVIDPVVVDEMDDIAQMTGLPEIKRASIFHASNHKAVVRRVAKNLWKHYDKINVIVAHIGDGVSVGAHKQGRVVDVNNTLDGDGPFSALSAGSLPMIDMIKLCFEQDASEEKLLNRIHCQSGVFAYLGKTDVQDIDKMLNEEDEKATMVIEAMGYQVAKEIGGLAGALDGRVDAIALTGEYAGCAKLVRYIKSKIQFLAPVFVYSGESETDALMDGALRVLNGEQEVSEYNG